jgi:hypothetical protein
VIVRERAERTAHHHVAKLIGAIERLDPSPEPLPNAEVPTFELYFVAQLEQPVARSVRDTLAGVDERADVEVDVTSEIEANLKWSVDVRLNFQISHSRKPRTAF